MLLHSLSTKAETLEETPIGQVIIALESLKMRMAAVEEALLKVKGFYREDSDGSQQNLIKFSPVEPQVAAVEPVV